DRPPFGIPDAEIDFVFLCPPIQWRCDDAGKLTGPMNSRGLPTVLQDCYEMVACRESQIVERGDERGNLDVPRVVGEPHVAVDNCQGFRIALDARQKARAKVK